MCNGQRIVQDRAFTLTACFSQNIPARPFREEKDPLEVRGSYCVSGPAGEAGPGAIETVARWSG